jgi:hypothetical protein
VTILDVRDIRGRVRRLLVSIPIGIVLSLAITLILPTRDHFPDPPGSCGNGHWDQGWIVEGGDPTLMLAGAFAIALAVYLMLNARARTRCHLPRARLLRSTR